MATNPQTSATLEAATPTVVQVLNRFDRLVRELSDTVRQLARVLGASPGPVAVERVRAQIRGLSPDPAPPTGTRTFSDAAKKRMSAGMREYWKKRRAKAAAIKAQALKASKAAAAKRKQAGKGKGTKPAPPKAAAKTTQPASVPGVTPPPPGRE